MTCLSQEVRFLQKWEPGYDHVFTQRAESHVAMMLGTRTATNHTDVTLGITMTTHEENGNVSLDTTFTSVKGSVEFLGQTVTFDSTDPTTTSDKAIDLVGKKFRTTIGANGHIGEMKGLEQIIGALGGQIDVTQFRELVESSHVKAFPPQAVPLGTTWKYAKPVELGPLGVLHPEIEYRFAEITEFEGQKVAKVDYTGVMTGKLKAGGGGLPVEIGEGSRISGTFFYQMDWSLIVSQKQELTVNLIVKQPDTPPVTLPVQSSMQLTLQSRKPTEPPPPPKE